MNSIKSRELWPNDPILILTFIVSSTASRNRNYARDSYRDDDRRSHSLDGDLILGPNLIQHLEKGKNRSAWSKVKGIVTNRTSRKSVKSTGSINSRDVSPIEVDLHRDRTDSLSSSNQPSPNHVGGFNLIIPDNDYGGNSSGYSHYAMSSDDNESKAFDAKQGKSYWQGKKGNGSRKSKHVPEIESLLEGVPLESKFSKKPIPNPLILQKVIWAFKSSPKALTDNFYSRSRITVNLMASKAATHQTQRWWKYLIKETQHQFPIVLQKPRISSRKMIFLVAEITLNRHWSGDPITLPNHHGNKMKFLKTIKNFRRKSTWNSRRRNRNGRRCVHL